jgi:Kef-type K+ transport system membrane component KefB/Trk K+ transport system NAD-binding subunit
MESTPSYVPLLIVLALAFAVPVLLHRFRRFGIPIVVGEIISGMVIGQSGLGLVPEDDPLLTLLAEFGFVFLMFIAGLEVDFASLRRVDRGRRRVGGLSLGPAQLGLAIFMLTLVLSTGVGFLLVQFQLAGNPWMLALILSTTSLGVVMPVLKERGLSTGRFGQAVLLAALIADFGTMLLITVLVATLSRGLTVDILVIGLLFVAFFLMVQLGLFSNRVPAFRRVIEELSHATAQIKVRAAFTLMLAFIVLSQMLGTEIILGAFLAGVVLSLMRTPDDAQLGHQLEAIGFGFFIPLFFIQVGVRFDLAALLASSSAMLLVPVLVVAAVAVKFIPSLLFRTVFSWREALSAGALLSARLSLIIAASAVGLRLGIISDSLNSAIVLVAIVTVTLAPLIFNRLAPSGNTVRGPVLVFGANELGLRIARHLLDHREQVVLLDTDARAVERVRQQDLDALLIVPPGYAEPLGARMRDAAAVICAHSDLEVNYECCKAACTSSAPNVLASVTDRMKASEFAQLGAMVISPFVDHAALLALVARNPSIYTLLTSTEDDKEVWEVTVRARRCAGKVLRELLLPGDALVLAVRRNGDYLVPHGSTKLARGDILTLIGSFEWIEPVRATFEVGED